MRKLATRDRTVEPLSRETKFSSAYGDMMRGKLIFPVELTTSRIDNLAGLINTLQQVMTFPLTGGCSEGLGAF